MIYFTSDIHFGHENIIKYCNRPFSSVDEMDDTLIKNWNSKVKPNDEIYVIGDFSFQAPSKYLPLLNGKKYLVLGNHDDRKVMEQTNSWVWIRDYYELKLQVNGQKQMIALFHFAMRTWNKQHHGSWHLFGHSHGGMPPHGKSFDIGVDCWNYFPLSLDEVTAEMDKLEIVKGIYE